MHNHYVSDFLIMLVIFHGSMSNNNKSRDWLDDSKWACRFHHSGSDQFRLTHFQYPQNPENVSIFPENFFVSIFEISRNCIWYHNRFLKPCKGKFSKVILWVCFIIVILFAVLVLGKVWSSNFEHSWNYSIGIIDICLAPMKN